MTEPIDIMQIATDQMYRAQIYLRNLGYMNDSASATWHYEQAILRVRIAETDVHAVKMLAFALTEAENLL